MATGTTVGTDAFVQSHLLLKTHDAAQVFPDLSRVALEGDEAFRLKTLYQSLLGRGPDTVETGQAASFLSEYRRAATEDDKTNNDVKDKAKLASPTIRAWRALCRVLLSSTEFVYAE